MYIRITRDKEVQVTAPSSVPREEVFRFIEEKKAWIQRNLSRMPETVNYDYHQGELHYFLGKRYVLHFYNSKESWLDLQDRQLMVGVSGRVRNRERLYVRLMKEELRQVILRLMNQWIPMMKVVPSDIHIKIMKSRWGSTNVKTGELCFALDLVTKPEECIETVVVHEMNHLLETGHTRRFHRLMKGWLPDYREREKLLSSWPREFM